MRYQAYQTTPDHIVLTVSQLYPVREVADFEVAPHTSAKTSAALDLPEVPWSEEDLAELVDVANATTLAIVDLCALSPDTWIGASDVYARAGVTVASGTGQLGGFGLTVRARFKRSNPLRAPMVGRRLKPGLLPDGLRASSYLASAPRERHSAGRECSASRHGL